MNEHWQDRLYELAAELPPPPPPVQVRRVPYTEPAEEPK